MIPKPFDQIWHHAGPARRQILRACLFRLLQSLALGAHMR